MGGMTDIILCKMHPLHCGQKFYRKNQNAYSKRRKPRNKREKSREMLKVKQNSLQHQKTMKVFRLVTHALPLGVTNISKKTSSFGKK